MSESLNLARGFEIALYSIWGLVVFSVALGSVKSVVMEVGKALVEFYLKRKKDIVMEMDAQVRSISTSFGTH